MAKIEVGKTVRPELRMEIAEALVDFINVNAATANPMVLEVQRLVRNQLLRIQTGLAKGTVIVKEVIMNSDLGFVDTGPIDIMMTKPVVKTTKDVMDFNTMFSEKLLASLEKKEENDGTKPTE